MKVEYFNSKVVGDDRGYFTEILKSSNAKINCLQINVSKSIKNVVRGLHFQTRKPQAKLIRVLHGEVINVAVDLRKENYGKVESFMLSSPTDCLLIPEGYANGFVVLSDFAIYHYVCSNEYDPGYEGCISPLDPDLMPDLPWSQMDQSSLIISDKDKGGVYFKDFVSPFIKEES